MTSTTARIGSFFFRYRNVLGPALFVLALIVGTPSFPFGSSGWNTAFDIAGIAVALLGQALRIVTIGYEYIERGGRNRHHAVRFAPSYRQGGSDRGVDQGRIRA